MKKTVLLIILFARIMLPFMCAAQTQPFSSLVLTGTANGNTNAFTNLTTVGTAGVTTYYGNGANLTGVAGGTNAGIAGTNGYGLLTSLAAPTLTNATLTTSNTSVFLTATNPVATNGLFLDFKGNTNAEYDRFWLNGVETYDVGIWDNTNKTWAVRDVQSGISPLTLSNANKGAIFTGSIYTSSNLYLPSGGVIYSGGNQLLMSYGSANVFAGIGAGNFSLTGDENTGIGNQSLPALTTGSYDISLGYQSMYSMQNASYNIGIGPLTLHADTDGNGNIAIGYDSLDILTHGIGNVVIGFDAGMSVTTGNYNIYLGYNSGAAANESGIIRIGVAGTQTDIYIPEIVHAGPQTNSGTGPNLLTLTNTYAPGDLIFEMDGQSARTNRIQMLINGVTNWTIAAVSNTISISDSNSVAAFVITNNSDNVGIAGNLNGNVINSIVTTNGSGQNNIANYTTVTAPVVLTTTGPTNNISLSSVVLTNKESQATAFNGPVTNNGPVTINANLVNNINGYLLFQAVTNGGSANLDFPNIMESPGSFITMEDGSSHQTFAFGYGGTTGYGFTFSGAEGVIDGYSSYAATGTHTISLNPSTGTITATQVLATNGLGSFSTVRGISNSVASLTNTFGINIFVYATAVSGTTMTNYDNAGNSWATNVFPASTNIQTFLQPGAALTTSTGTGTIFTYHAL